MKAIAQHTTTHTHTQHTQHNSNAPSQMQHPIVDHKDAKATRAKRDRERSWKEVSTKNKRHVSLDRFNKTIDPLLYDYTGQLADALATVQGCETMVRRVEDQGGHISMVEHLRTLDCAIKRNSYYEDWEGGDGEYLDYDLVELEKSLKSLAEKAEAARGVVKRFRRDLGFELDELLKFDEEDNKKWREGVR